MAKTRLHKGYVPTKDKKCLMPFKGRSADELYTFEQVRNLPEYAGILADNTALIDIDDFEESEIMMRIVEALDLKCRVYATTRGKHFLFLNNGMLESCKGRTKTGIGLTVDIKLGCRNSYSILKYNGEKRKVLRDIDDGEEYDTVPKWISPVKSSKDFVSMAPGDGRNQALFEYILTLQSFEFSVSESRECIKLINEYVLKEPLSEREIDTVLRDEAFQKPSFFKGKEFLFDTFARFLVNEHHMVKIGKRLHIYNDGIYSSDPDDIESIMIDHIPRLPMSKRTEVLKYLNICIKKKSKMADPRYIAFKNGVLDIVTMELLPFSPEYIILNRIDHNYNPNAYSEVVDTMFNKLSVNDPEVRALLEELIGYCFYRSNAGFRKSFILTGDKRNGKSTYIDMLMNILGEDNTTALDLKELGERFKTVEVFGKLACLGDDIEEDYVKTTSIFKKLTSGDRINVENKGEKTFNMNSYAKLIFSANDIPKMKDRTGAVLDRMIFIPFDATFRVTDPDFDPNIRYKLQAEECMEYAILLGIEGLKRVLTNNSFTESQRVTKALKEYEESNNPILLFFSDIDADDVVNKSTKSIYEQYNEFCLANNFKPMSQGEFSKQVNKRLGLETSVKKVEGKSTRVFVRK